MLHRAVLGSFERFIGILLENYSGRLPMWLSPIQVGIATINDECINYSKQLEKRLNDEKIRCILDDRNEKLNYKIRELSLKKIPFIVVVGKKEIEENLITLRVYGEDTQYTLKYDEFIKKIKNSCRIG
jgi:threonyl-tRNA synthetase